MSASSPREFKKPKDEDKAAADKDTGAHGDFLVLQADFMSEARRLKDNVDLLRENKIEVPKALLGLEDEFAQCTTVEELAEVFQSRERQWELVLGKLDKVHDALGIVKGDTSRALSENDKKISDLALVALEGFNALKEEVEEGLDQESANTKALDEQTESLIAFLKGFYSLTPPESRKEAKEITQLRQDLEAELGKVRTEVISTPAELQEAIERVRGHLKDFVRVVDLTNGEKNIGSEKQIKSKLFGGASGSSLKLRNLYKGTYEGPLEELSTIVRDLKKYMDKDSRFDL